MEKEQDMMSLMKKLTRVDKEGGSMSKDERSWFDEAKKNSIKFDMQINLDKEHKK